MDLKALSFSKRSLIYFFIYAIFFSYYIVNNSLPGLIDNLYMMAVFNDISQWLGSLFGGVYTEANYPEGKIIFQGELGIAIGVIYSMLHLVIENEVLCFNLVYLLSFFLNALCLDLLIRQIFKVENSWILISSVLVFTFSSYNLGMMDNLSYSLWFPGFLSIYFWYKWLENGYVKNAWLFSLLFSIQLFSSVYNFVMISLIILLLSLLFFRKQFVSKFSLAYILVFVAFGGFVWLHVYEYPIIDVYEDAIRADFSENVFSIELFKNRIPFHWSDKAQVVRDLNYYWHLFYPGIGLTISFFLLFFTPKNKRYFLFTMFLVLFGFLLSSGSSWGGVRNIVNEILWSIPELYRFKLVFKFYYLIILGLVFSWALLWDYAFKTLKIKQALWLLFIVTGVQILDQIPLSQSPYSHQVPNLSLGESDLKRIQSSGKAVMILPMYAPTLSELGQGDLFVAGRYREYLYYFYKSKYDIHIVNGSEDFLMQKRIELNEVLLNDSLENGLQVLKKEHGAGWIIFRDDDLMKDDSFSQRMLDAYQIKIKSGQDFLLEI